MRINVVPVKELMDQHLVAEYREIKMLPKMLVRSLKSKNGVDFDALPKSYTMGKGHGKFFYNKLEFIQARFKMLLVEMVARGFSINSDKLFMDNFDYSALSSVQNVSYIPCDIHIEINRARINQRISERANFYRYYGVQNAKS